MEEVYRDDHHMAWEDHIDDDNNHSVALGTRSAYDSIVRLEHHSDGGTHSDNDDDMAEADTLATGCEADTLATDCGGREEASVHYLSLGLVSNVAYCHISPHIETPCSLGLKGDFCLRSPSSLQHQLEVENKLAAKGAC
mmetsp:Transcript_42466/g.72469  ORF Transcript_42466/g.72469 Transcript_42466/m.72469 type:complete len:139 (+) Transcript_42466:1039-1455(+)